MVGLGIPDKDDVAFCHMLLCVCGEEQIAPPRLLDHLKQARFIDGQFLLTSAAVQPKSMLRPLS